MRTPAIRPGTTCMLLAAAIMALAVGLRLRHAAASMVFDEMASLYFASQPWRHLWGWWMVRETNPPLFYSLLKVWTTVLPIGHWWLRALPLAIGCAQLVLFGVFVRRRLGWLPALLGLLLFALSWSDIYQATYLRGYGCARLAVMVSFIGLVEALEAGARRAAVRGWAMYSGGAVIAIFCHTTMVLWPVIATVVVLAEAVVWRGIAWRRIAALFAANAVAMVLSGWVLIMAVAQLRSGRAANIAWLESLGWSDFWATCNLQLLTGGVASAVLMAVLVVIGAWRGRQVRLVRLAAGVALVTLPVFKATDAIHPIISDFTLHWAFSFTALVASAALLPALSADHAAQGWWRRATGAVVRGAGPAVLAAVLILGLIDLLTVVYISVPQDWRQTVRTVAAHPGAALLASHEAEGVVIEQACRVEFGAPRCPFPLVVLTDPRTTDNWAFGGYRGQLVAPAGVRAALGQARVAYAFSRYYYTPLQHVGLDPGDWPEVFWDDGELIGPIPVAAFDPPAPGEPPRVPDPDAEYTGAPDDSGDYTKLH
ncbi:hypothetical protein [Novosphingobium sp.]|uniref:hypothetical protein n=1 Tax=Novosphingobium sp. TaxID=1874826 RepID=UPI00334286FA